MNNTFSLLVFVIGFFCGIGVLFSIKFFLPKTNNKQNENESSGNKHGSYRAGYNMSNDGFSNMFKLRGGAGKFVLHHEEYINGSLAIQKLILLLSIVSLKLSPLHFLSLHLLVILLLVFDVLSY